MISAFKSKYNTNKSEIMIALLFQGKSWPLIVLIYIIDQKLTL